MTGVTPMTTTTSPQSLFDKVWNAHVVAQRGSDAVLLHIDRHLLHDLSGGEGLQELKGRALGVRNAELTIGTPDHVISTTPGRRDTIPVGLRLLSSPNGDPDHNRVIATAIVSVPHVGMFGAAAFPGTALSDEEFSDSPANTVMGVEVNLLSASICLAVLGASLALGRGRRPGRRR